MKKPCVGAGIQKLSTEMIDRLYASRTRNSLRNIPSPRTNLSFNQLKIFYYEKGFTVNDSFLKNLDLYTSNGELNYVAYLLADQNSVSIKVAKYVGIDKVELVENDEYGYCSLICRVFHAEEQGTNEGLSRFGFWIL